MKKQKKMLTDKRQPENPEQKTDKQKKHIDRQTDKSAAQNIILNRILCTLFLSYRAKG